MSFNRFIKKLSDSKAAQLAVLIDPDKFNPDLVLLANKCEVACFLVGGSKLQSGSIKSTVKEIKQLSHIPVILFPGDEKQLTEKADGLFLPSLVSGRNPDYLITKQIKMAPLIKKMKLRHLPMAYVLIDGKKKSTTEIVTGTEPLNPKKTDVIIHTCMAAEQLGFKLIYLEAGSGARSEIASTLIKKVKQNISVPLIVGGGIDSAHKIKQIIRAGANLIVVGNALEKDVHLLTALGKCFIKK